MREPFAKQETLTWVATTDRGSAVLTLPSDLTVEDVKDITEWFALILLSLSHRVLGAAALREPGAKPDD